jgi:hypothetical protein
MATITIRARATSWLLGPAALAGALIAVLFTTETPWAAEPAAASPQVEIKKLSTGKEATIRHGEKEWHILIDVDQDRTMIIRSESNRGKETSNKPEILERPMSNTEVDRVISDFVAGIKSTLKP